MIDELPAEFVAESDEISLRLRAELGLDCGEALDPRAVASHLAISVVSIEHYREAVPAEVAQLTEVDVGAFAAASVFCGSRCLIIINPSQSDTEEALSIAHEIAHRELEHEPSWPLFDEDGERRRGHEREEAEAEQLAGAILVPGEGIEVVLARHGANVMAAAAHFGVGVALMRRRIREVGRAPAPSSPEGPAIARGPQALVRRVVGPSDGEPAPAGSPAG